MTINQKENDENLVDTCVWSQALRRKSPDKEIITELTDLINDGLVVTIGPIKQELLSGIANDKQFNKIQNILSSFESVPLDDEVFIKAAEFSNVCRSKGVQGSAIEYLICAAAFLFNLSIFTIDNDFKYYSSHIPVMLF